MSELFLIPSHTYTIYISISISLSLSLSHTHTHTHTHTHIYIYIDVEIQIQHFFIVELDYPRSPRKFSFPFKDALNTIESIQLGIGCNTTSKEIHQNKYDGARMSRTTDIIWLRAHLLLHFYQHSLSLTIYIYIYIYICTLNKSYMLQIYNLYQDNCIFYLSIYSACLSLYLSFCFSVSLSLSIYIYIYVYSHKSYIYIYILLIYAYMYVLYLYTYTYIYECVCICCNFMYMYMFCTYLYIWVYVCVCVVLNVYIHINCTYRYPHIYCTCVCVCVYLWVCILQNNLLDTQEGRVTDVLFWDSLKIPGVKPSSTQLIPPTPINSPLQVLAPGESEDF